VAAVDVEPEARTCSKCSTVEADPNALADWEPLLEPEPPPEAAPRLLWLCPMCWPRAFLLLLDWVTGRFDA